MKKERGKSERTIRHASSPTTGDPLKTKPGRKPSHTTAEIAKVGVGIADSEGIEAVSMRRIASEMKSGTASLYRYVTKKDELLDLMVDYVRGKESFPKLSGNWRFRLRKIADGTRALVLRHPWLSKVSPVRTSLGLNSLRWWEFRLQILDGLGLDIDEMIVMINTLDNFVKGYAAAETNELEEARSSGIEHERWLEDHAQYVLSVVSSGELPLFNRVVRDAKAPHDPERMDHEFALAVGHILDGFAVHIAKKLSPSKSRLVAAPGGQRSKGGSNKKEKRKS